MGPLLISATVEASNFKFGTQLRFGTTFPKNNVQDQNQRGSGPREHPNKIWDPLRISATVEADNFKFGMQLGFRTSLPKNNVQDQNCQGSIQKNVGAPIYFCNRLKNWYTTGLPCQTQVLGPNQVGSELGEYHSPSHYDDDATVYSTCYQKLTGTHISLLSGIKQKNLSGKRLKTDQHDQVRLRHDTIVCIQRAVKS